MPLLSEPDPSAPMFHLHAAEGFRIAVKADLPTCWKQGRHPVWILTTGGAADYVDAGLGAQHLSRGWALLRQPQDTHEFRLPAHPAIPWEGVFLCFSGQFAEERLNFITSHFGTLHRISPEAECAGLANELAGVGRDDVWHRARLAFQWYHTWWREIEEERQRVIRLIENADSAKSFAREPVSLKRLAAQLGYSPGYLSIMLGQKWGEKPSNLLRRERLEFAAQRLRESDVDVDTLAHELGYQSTSSFIRAFRLAYGLPPAKYRNQQSASA